MTKFIDPSEGQESDLPPSKSQRKRDMKELQKLGKQLVEAPIYLVDKLNLDEDLSNAIQLARRLSNDRSKRRQLLYIGQLLSQIETEEIRQALDSHKFQQHQTNKAFHNIEKWRDKLVQGGDEALKELLNEHSNLDRQHLRQLIRNAQKEASLQKPPASSRAIFRYLNDNIKLKDSE